VGVGHIVTTTGVWTGRVDVLLPPVGHLDDETGSALDTSSTEEV
jgi:hypothetical protein